MSIRADFSAVPAVQFELPPGSEATVPPEQRGVPRDRVRLLVAGRGGVQHAVFRDLPAHLHPGDLVVVNTSATIPAALRVSGSQRATTLMHVAGELDDGSWVVELRRDDNHGFAADVTVGETLALPVEGRLVVAASYPVEGVVDSRLWVASPDRPVDRVALLSRYGDPIRYGYVPQPWPLAALQNVYADQPGSAEMASAGRPFTDDVLHGLTDHGIRTASIVLHTGVSSPEKHEPPVPERFEVSETTARLVNETAAAGGRVVAVGTTVVRALETAVGADGLVRPQAGWTDLVLGPASQVRAVTGLVTGLHEPAASHLLLLEAVAGRRLVAQAYGAAVAQRYLWHEFGDSMLFLP